MDNTSKVNKKKKKESGIMQKEKGNNQRYRYEKIYKRFIQS